MIANIINSITILIVSISCLLNALSIRRCMKDIEDYKIDIMYLKNDMTNLENRINMLTIENKDLSRKCKELSK